MKNQEAQGVVIVGEGECSDDEVVRQEYAYIMSLHDLASFVALYGVQKVVSDFMGLVVSLEIRRAGLKEEK